MSNFEKKTCYHCNHEVPNRSHSRGRETASAGPGSTRFHRNFQMPWRHKLARLSCGISGEGRSFCDFVGVLSELFKCFISRSAMHGQWKNEPIRNTFITKTPRSCNGPAVRIEGKKPKGKLWLETKTKTKRKKIYTTTAKNIHRTTSPTSTSSLDFSKTLPLRSVHVVLQQHN